MNIELTEESVKSQARLLKKFLETKDIKISHGWCLDAISAQYEYVDYNVLAAVLKAKASSEEPSPVLRGKASGKELSESPVEIKVFQKKQGYFENFMITGRVSDFEDIYEFIFQNSETGVFEFESFMIGMSSMFRKAWERGENNIEVEVCPMLVLCGFLSKGKNLEECPAASKFINDFLEIITSADQKRDHSAFTTAGLTAAFVQIQRHYTEDECVGMLDEAYESKNVNSHFLSFFQKS